MGEKRLLWKGVVSLMLPRMAEPALSKRARKRQRQKLVQEYPLTFETGDYVGVDGTYGVVAHDVGDEGVAGPGRVRVRLLDGALKDFQLGVAALEVKRASAKLQRLTGLPPRKTRERLEEERPPKKRAHEAWAAEEAEDAAARIAAVETADYYDQKSGPPALEDEMNGARTARFPASVHLQPLAAALTAEAESFPGVRIVRAGRLTAVGPSGKPLLGIVVCAGRDRLRRTRNRVASTQNKSWRGANRQRRAAAATWIFRREIESRRRRSES